MNLLGRLPRRRRQPVRDVKCPEHGTPMVYWPAGDVFACSTWSCQYFHGVGAAKLEDVLAGTMKAEGAQTPLGEWTVADLERYGDHMEGAIIGGHLRDSGIAGIPGIRCPLHGTACREACCV